MFGKFNGNITDYGVSESQAGNPQVFITFAFECEGAQKTMSWYGSFAGGAKDITLKTLIYCGLQPQHYNQLVNFKNGTMSNMLDLSKVLELDIQEEPDYKDPTKMRSKINWVNDPASAPQIKKIDEAKNAQFFGSMGFDGDLIRLAGDMGLSLNNGMNANMGAPQNHNVNTQQNFQAPPQNNAPAPQNNYNQNQMPPQNNGQQNFNAPAPQNNGQAPVNGQGFKAPF